MTEQRRIQISPQVIIGEMQSQIEFLQGRSYQLASLLETATKSLEEAKDTILELEVANGDMKQKLGIADPVEDAQEKE